MKRFILTFTALTCLANPVAAQTMEEFAQRERGAARLIERADGETAGKSDSENSRYAFTSPSGSYHELAFIDGNTPVFRKGANLRESNIIRATEARSEMAVFGRDVAIGLWDMGRAYPHPEFIDRLEIAVQDGGFPLSSHATHVAGTLVASGIDREATGIAPEARVVSYDWRYDYMEMYERAQNGLRVSNHSYSFEAGWEEVFHLGSFFWNYRSDAYDFGRYTVPPWFWDDVMWTNPYYLAVKAVGNEAGQGPEEETVGHFHDGDTNRLHFDHHDRDCASGYGCIGSLSTSKNALVVGALDGNGEVLAGFSSRGPTLDGRVKPDVVSAGTGVYSTLGEDGYGVSSGTSMASPTVAGSIALMLELERNLFGADKKLRASTIKALLIHAADDLGEPGPDFHYGWGRVDVQRTLSMMEASLGDAVQILEPQIQDGFSLDLISSGGEFVVTLAWTDPAGKNPNTIRDQSTPVLVEDLDLVIEKDGVTYHPYVLDPVNPADPATTGVNRVDNVEQVRLSGLSAGPLTVIVTRKNGSADPLVASIVVSGVAGAHDTPTGTPGSPDLSESISVYPNPARSGQTVRVEGQLDRIQSVTVDLVGSKGELIERLQDGELGWLDISWQVPSTLASGAYFVRIEGESIREARPLFVVR